MSRAPASEDVAAREPRQISRRTVAKGAAWSVPVIAFAAGTPAYAASAGCSCDTVAPGLQFTSDNYTVVYFSDDHSSGTPSSDNVFYTGGGNQAIGWRTSFTVGAGWHHYNNKAEENCTDGYVSKGDYTISSSDGVFTAQGDPKAKGASIVIYRNICVDENSDYYFSLDWISYNVNPVTANLQMGVTSSEYSGSAVPSGSSTSATVTARRHSSHGSKKVWNGKGTLDWKVSNLSAGTHGFYIRVWFNSLNSYSDGSKSGCAEGANDFGIGNLKVSCTKPSGFKEGCTCTAGGGNNNCCG